MLARIAPAVRPALQAAAIRPIATRGVVTLTQTAYTAAAEATGQGRNGRTVVPEAGLDFKLAQPKALGGSGDGVNPEQLFSAGYAACFLSALRFGAKSKKLDVPDDLKIKVEVHVGKPDTGKPFGLAADIYAETQSQDKEHIQKLLEVGHDICPYSNATGGNIVVELHP